MTKIEKAVDEFKKQFIFYSFEQLMSKDEQEQYAEEIKEDDGNCYNEAEPSDIEDYFKQALLTAHQQGKKDAYSEILLEQHKNELESKGYDFYFAIRNKLDKLINQNNEK